MVHIQCTTKGFSYQSKFEEGMILVALDKNGKPLPPGITWRENKQIYMIRFTYQGVSYTYYEKTLKDAKKTLADRRYEVQHGQRGKADKVSLDSWYETWLTTYKIPNIKETSVRTYKHWYTCYIQPVLGKRYLTRIKPVDIQGLINDYQEKGLSVKTIYSIYGVIFDLFEIAYINDRILKNPAKNIKLPKQEKVERRVLSVNEQTTFLAHLKNEKWLPHEPLFVGMLGTGMRIGEAVGLTWDCVDFDRKEIHIDKALVYGKSVSDGKYRFTFQSPKTSSSKRVIPMLKEVEDALYRQFNAQERLRQYLGDKWQPLAGFENLVFANMSGRPYRETHIRDFLVAIIQEINDEEIALAEKGRREPVLMEHFSPHSLRHTFATRAFERNVPPKSVQAILGHSSVAMTMDLYTHTTEDKKREDMEKLDGVFTV